MVHPVLRPGICSVTFRDRPIEEVAGLAAEAGLACIEWAGDAHVPPRDDAAARRAREATLAAGLKIASYGSYLRFEGEDADVAAEGEAVLRAAQTLGAPRIRVWAGRSGSAEVGPRPRAVIVERIRRFADAAAAAGIEVGLEFHGHTLTDEIGSTLQLLDEIGRENVLSYWQPHQDMPIAEALGTLRQVLPRTSTIHVFSWWPANQRLPLAARADLWREAFTILAADGTPRDALLEFIPGSDPASLRDEADTLRSLITAGLEASQ